MENPRQKFQTLLKELFQFDCADLDFGIYRILNQKRDVIQRFIEHDLLDAVTEELNRGALLAQTDAAQDLAAARQAVIANVAEDAFDSQGNLKSEHQGTIAGKVFMYVQARAAGARPRDAIETAIFNHLYSFFSRYYDAGDFMSKRRYSKRERYAIPYNGEEVYLHWANKDQYYIKTTEVFRDYSFKYRDVTVHFQVKEASVERDNVKGEKRFFVPRCDETAYEEEAREVTVPFEYRPLTEQESLSLGKTRQQEKIVLDAVSKIVAKLDGNHEALLALTTEWGKTPKNEPISLLEHHLRRYTTKNTSDYFIHKNLREFLARELDFYLKNEVLNLDDIGAAGVERSEGWFQMMEVVRAIGTRIIAFLAQVEEFQKRIFEKRKFVTQIRYCITLDRVPEEMYAEIAACDAQRRRWVDLCAIDKMRGDLATPGYSEPLTVGFLKAHKSLVVDTAYFSADFFDRIAALAPDLDAVTDGLLVRSENFQALTLLQQGFAGRVRCVCIDPPYNTDASAIPYKNDYRHSSWATMMHDRLALLRTYLERDGVIFVSIDKHERTPLEFAMDSTFGGGNRIEELVWVQNTNDGRSPTYSTNHEYVEVYAQNAQAAEANRRLFRVPKPGYHEVMALVERLQPDFPPPEVVEEQLRALYQANQAQYREDMEDQGIEWEEAKRTDPWNGIYQYKFVEYRDPGDRLVPYDEARTRGASICVYQESDWTIMSSEAKQSPTIRDPDHPNFRFYDVPHPTTGKLCARPSRGWKGTRLVDPEHPERKSMESMLQDNRIAFGPDETKVPREKRMLHEVASNVEKSVFTEYADGEKETRAMFGRPGVFLAPKHTNYVLRFLNQVVEKNSVVVDCFGGSGSTADAVVRYNRENDATLKYVLVEVNDYFDTVLLPRVMKSVYASKWCDGAPKSSDGASQLVKVLRLESYEDALDSVTIPAGHGQQAMHFDDYVLNYMIDFETAGSDTLLNVEKLDKPFSYRLRIYEGGETKEKPADLAETFNHLIGLHVKTRRAYNDGERRYLVYRGTAVDKDTVVIWRETRDWGAPEYERDRQFVAEKKLAEGAEIVYVNCDSRIPNARSLDPEFKRLMFAPVEV